MSTDQSTGTSRKDVQVYYDFDRGTWRSRDHGGWGPEGDHVSAGIAMEYIESLLDEGAAKDTRIAELEGLLAAASRRSQYWKDNTTAASAIIDKLDPYRGRWDALKAAAGLDGDVMIFYSPPGDTDSYPIVSGEEVDQLGDDLIEAADVD